MTDWTEDVRQAAMGGAIFAFSLSGGKDSTAAASAAIQQLDAWGHPRERRVAIHADLGRAEWEATPRTVEAVAGRFGLPVSVVRHRTHDMVSRWEERFKRGKARYHLLEVFNLIGPWSSAALRFCTAEMKQQVIAPALLRAFPGQIVVSVVGIRRDESPARSIAPISKWEPRWARSNGGRMLTWHPVVTWSTAAVFARHAEDDLPLHEAYRVYGSGRVSCAFCVMQNAADQAAAARATSNADLYRHLVAIEANSTFSFQPTRWLGDVAPRLLSEGLAADLVRGKAMAAQRRTLEAALPSGLRYVKGWPLRVPTPAEAVQVADARRVILGHHGLYDPFVGPAAIIDRFHELMLTNGAHERLAA